MKLTADIRLTAHLSLDDREAEVLELLCSFDLATWFADKCSRQLTAEHIKQTLDRLRQAAARVVTARNKALNVVRGEAGNDA